MRRREFIGLLGGAAVTWPKVGRAQQPERVRRIAVLMSAADDPEGQARLAAFLQAMQRLGWTIGRNVHLDLRWGGGDVANIRRYATELVALMPEVLLAPGSSTVGPLLQATSTMPIVFVHLLDPVGSGFVASLAQPGGNATGLSQFEFGMSTKWVELLREIAPRVLRAAVLRDPMLTSGLGQFGAVQGAASSIGIELTPVGLRDPGEMERAIATFARSPNGSVIVTANPLAVVHRELIVGLAARHKLPAIYFERFFVAAGGLMAYGPDLIDQYRRAADYVDRILKGEKPADLPVQAPTKYELVLNLKTARALGLTVPTSLIARADEVIE